MRRRTKRAEQPLTFAESLPAGERLRCWLPVQQIMLTLPDAQGAYRVFTVHRCPQTQREAWNVAHYRPEVPHGD